MCEIKQIGNVMQGMSAWENPSVGRVYDALGISPTINSMQGGGKQPSIVEIKDLTGRSAETCLTEQSRAEQSSLVYVKQATHTGMIACNLPGIADLNYPTSKTRRGRVIEQGSVSPTLTTESVPSVLERWTWEIDGVTYLIRIRKLTPKECWRLMDFTDEDFNKAASVNSNTQLYKQAGNSIVKNVLCEVFKSLIDESCLVTPGFMNPPE